ncbi:MAG: Omp28-related outer membrane protein [Saprospiraceae bacterium]|nr:Omp28-related outer membrane protein [Candidatus Brachybacter algidus]MBK8746581.1 Omp28-related outer membrane protein [Candidatus Brachybacter algidus]
MMINIFRLSCFLFISFLFNSCSETEIIVPKAGEIISDRVVLIEDFTGVKCPNCPNAAREITSLMGRYPKNVVAVAYHTEFLGSPITEPSEYKSKYDFRTQDGEALEGQMGFYLGKPAVSLDRKIYNPLEDYILTSTAVLGNIENELRSIPKAKIMINNTYDFNTRKLIANITIDPVVQTSGEFRIHALVTESDILDSQEDNIIFVKEYQHNHVFRQMLTELAGDPIGLTLTPGSQIKRTYEFTLPPENGWWVAKNCQVVAFISDLSQKTYSVGAIVQAAEHHVID